MADLRAVVPRAVVPQEADLRAAASHSKDRVDTADRAISRSAAAAVAVAPRDPMVAAVAVADIAVDLAAAAATAVVVAAAVAVATVGRVVRGAGAEPDFLDPRVTLAARAANSWVR